MAESRTNGEGKPPTGSVKGEDIVGSTQDSTPGDSGMPDGGDVLTKGASVGRYMVLERLGEGAMGVVYAAYDPELDRKIALKLLRPHSGKGDQGRRQARLVREAKAIAKLSHPNVVGIFDVGVHEGQVYLAMEFLGGGTLRDWVEAEKRPWREIVKMFIEVGKGLAGAHAEGLIHRDFKPDNVLLDKNGVPKVVDFGLVRLASAALDASTTGTLESSGAYEQEEEPTALPLAATALAALTRTGALTGTPAYMAAEQFLGKTIDARTDQFAFCVALYEALYGERPFAGETVIALADSVTSERVRAIPKNSDIPTWIRRCLSRGLRSNPADRYADFEDLLATLRTDPVARVRRRIGVVTAVVAVVATVLGLQRRAERRRVEFEQQVTARFDEGRKAFSEARTTKQVHQDARARSFVAFDANRSTEAERIWTEARSAATSLDSELARAQGALEGALALDKTRTNVRATLAEVIYERALLAEIEFRTEDLRRHLRHLDTVDSSGAMKARWTTPGTLILTATPAGARVVIEKNESRDGAGRFAATQVAELVSAQGTSHSMPAGSYRMRITKTGHAEVLYSFIVRRGEPVSIDVVLPREEQVPTSFAYIPAGAFLFGTKDEELRTSFLDTAPIHPSSTGAFLIAKNETTFGEWIEFLEAQPARARTAYMPAGLEPGGASVRLSGEPGRWKLSFRPYSLQFNAEQNESIAYAGRKYLREHNWLKMPVTGITGTDAEAYASWYQRRHNLKVRLCTEREWERAARGADDREYPHADVLSARDANIDIAHEKNQALFGLDETGSHPQSQSPFGIQDMAGNANELTTSAFDRGDYVIRGGSYYQNSNTARSTNRGLITKTLKAAAVGFRLCADLAN
jgi:formylglycine-generating enzyme required for sulfatase activity